MKLVTALLLTAGLYAAELKLGKPLTLTQTTPIPMLLASPADHVGKIVQVKGKVTEVCQNAGCWMALADDASGKAVRIKVKDGEIVFPKESVGKQAVAEGKFTKIEMTKEQAVAYLKHQAEENKKPFDPASVKGPLTIYQVAGTGAVIAE